MIRNHDNDLYHVPVMVQEVIQGLNVREGKRYIDATVGGGGHTKAIVNRGGIVLGIDADLEAISHIKEHVIFTDGNSKELSRVHLVHGNFKDIETIVKEHAFGPVEGVLFDLGVSSHQLDEGRRGFSIRANSRLDMRMDSSSDYSAFTVVNKCTEEELYEIFTTFSEEINSRAIAHSIVRARSVKPIETTQDLADIVLRLGLNTKSVIRVFQGIRIKVNNELENLREALVQAQNLVEIGGRIVIISFHSLEDRIVKRSFTNNYVSLYKKPVTAGQEELKRNPRSRSAKLRVYERKT